MFDIQNYASFVAAIVIFQVILGAGTLAIFNATARNGISAGLGAVIGTLVGDFIVMIAAVVGLAIFMNANPYLFQGLRWIGAGYLCWLGLQRSRAPVTQVELGIGTRKSCWVYFHQAYVVSLTNPKVILCLVPFFPLFLRPGASTMTLVAMMVHVIVIILIYQACIVLLGIAAAPA